MNESDQLYSFTFKGLMAQEALEQTDALKKAKLNDELPSEIAGRIPFEDFDSDLVAKAQAMAVVYTAVASFENTVREFVSKKLLDEKGENWWEESVSEKIRKKAESRQEEENRVKWHTARGEQPINFTDFSELISIILQNWELFEPHLENIDWVKQMLKTVERSRNVIMHSGILGRVDIERIGSCMRDWIRQVGA